VLSPDRVDPDEAGLATDRLRRAEHAIDERIARGEIPGAVAMIQRAGRTAWCYAAGLGNAATGARIRADSIFRVYSMTKPLTSLAALVLSEEGLVDLSAPAGRYLPELAELPVLDAEASTARGALVTVPARRPMTVYDLLRHTSGIVGGYHGSSVIGDAYRQAGIVAFDHNAGAYESSSADLVTKLSRLPLAHQPGTVWEYGRSGDVLGRLLEVATGRPLDEILRTRVCGPAGMVDTGFHVPQGEAGRIVQPLTTFVPGELLIDLTERPRFLSGGSGCYGTAGDFLRFGRMVLDHGAVDGRQVLSARSVALATSDHLGSLSGSGPDYVPGEGYGFGLGFAVRTAAGGSPVLGSAGDLWWLGRAATSFLVDPAEELVAVLMTQRYWAAREYQRWFKNLVYQAIVG